MIIRRLLVLLLLVIAPIPVAAGPAWACSCKEGAGIAEAELAFDGVVRSVSPGGGEDRVRFAVETVVKGSAGAEVTLTTSDGPASCGYRFDVGARYRVHASNGVTSLCSGNEMLSAGAGRVDRVSTDRALVFWTGSGIVTLLVVVAMALLIRGPKARSPRD